MLSKYISLSKILLERVERQVLTVVRRNRMFDMYIYVTSLITFESFIGMSLLLASYHIEGTLRYIQLLYRNIPNPQCYLLKYPPYPNAVPKEYYVNYPEGIIGFSPS